MDSNDLTWLTISQLAPLIRTRQVSPVEVVQAMLERIERLDNLLRVFIMVTPDRALAEAKAAESEIAAGRYLGPLHGVPVAHKDVYLTKGVLTTAHSRLFQDFVPTEDAALVAAWKAAGAISLGKTNTYELAGGRQMRLYGIPRNPWRLDRVTGGSSCGSGSGLAAGLFYGASGSDSGGSIRAPAAMCGVAGLKPTFGLVSRRGEIPQGWSTNCAGPMARGVADLALLLQPIAGYDPRDPSAVPAPSPLPDYSAGLDGGLNGLQVGVPTDYFLEPASVASSVYQAVWRAIEALRELGAELVEVPMPHVHLSDDIHGVITAVEGAGQYRELLATRPDDFELATRARLEAALRISGDEYLQAQRLRSLVKADYTRAFETADVIVTPAAFQTARGPLDDDQHRRPHPRRSVNHAGGPAVSIPCGFDDEGLPIGLQIVGRPWDEATVLRTAYAYEQAHPLGRRPELSERPAGPPLTIPAPTIGIEAAIQASLERMRGEVASALASAELDGVAPATRFQP